MTGNLIEKSLKRYLKRKVKITLGLITAFLITGSVSFSAIEIGYDGSNITVTNDIGKVIDNFDGSFTWINDKDNEINDEIIIKEELLSSGIVLNIENNGIISTDKNSETGNGNGIYVNTTEITDGKIGNIINNGIISGNSEITNIDTENQVIEYIDTGNGVGVYSGFGQKMELGNNIINNGVISGSGTISEQKPESEDIQYINIGNGIGIYSNFGEILSLKNNIINNGIINGDIAVASDVSMEGLWAGNGIGICGRGFNGYGSISLNNIDNKGIIIGYGNNEGSNTGNIGNGIGLYGYINDISLNGINNKGIIYGQANIQDTEISNIGNGIGLYSYESDISLNNIDNKGIITGYAAFYSNETANMGNGIGIYKYATPLTFGDINNFGYIKGEARGIVERGNSGNGFSIYNIDLIRDVINETVTLNGNIFNNGIIVGNVIKDTNDKILYAVNSVSSGGNGLNISNYSEEELDIKKRIGNISNNGIISGNIIGNVGGKPKLEDWHLEEGFSSGGNGLSIYNYSKNISYKEVLLLNTIFNSGISVGNVIGSIHNNSTGGNGLSIYNANGTITLNNDIINNGILTGYVEGTINDTSSGGNGLSVYNYNDINGTGTITLNNLTNTGLIIGSEHGVYLHDINMNGQYCNYGITAGSKGAVVIENKDNALIKNKDNNYGLYLTFDDKGEVTAVSEGQKDDTPIDINGQNFTIKNGEVSGNTTKTINSSEINGKSGYILNGVNDTLTVNRIDTENKTATTLNNSIINAYKNAVLINNGNFEGTNVTINGGGLRIKDENGENVGTNTAVTGSGNKDVFTLKGNSILNGDVNMNGGDDEVSFDNEVQINGNLDGGDGADILNLGINGADIKGNLENTFDSSLRIYHNITGFETINIKDNVTVFETAKIEGTGNLVIEKGNQLNLRIDGTKKEGDIIVGHALYESDFTITGTVDSSTDDTITEGETDKYEKAGILNLVTSGLGTGSVISFGKTSFDTENVWVKTDNLLDNVTINGSTATIEGEKDIFKIIAKADPSDPSDTSGKLYEKLNEVYKGAYSSGDENFIELKNIIANAGIKGDGDYTEVTDEQQLKTLLRYLKEIYTNSPYSFTSDASRKSMGMFRDIIRENNFKALDDEWIIYGGLTHNDGSREQTYYGKNYHKFDTGAYDNSADIKITGAYAQAEYGIDNTLSAGVLFGGNKSDIEVSHSKADGTSMYLGGYLKKDIRDFRITGGAGIQYSEYDAERNISNRQYDDKYSDNAFDIYVNTKYFYEISEGLFFEPYGQFSYSYVDQEGISENDGALSLNVDDKDFTFAEGTIGADLRKEIIKDNIKHNFKAGVSYTRLLDGYKEDNLTADFGGNSFDLLVPHKTPDELRIGVRYELERTDGLMFSANADYLISMDSKDNGHKNENKDEWRIGAGIGYRF